MTETFPRRRTRRPSARERPRPALSRASLEQAALSYLARYESSAAHLARVLERKLVRERDRSGEAPPAEASSWIRDVVDGLVARGLVDDRRFAEELIRSLRRRGSSQRALRQKLREKGVSTQLVRDLLEREAGEHRELEAASRYARRRGLGPYRTPAQRDERRDRDLAALARAGFDFGTARRVIDAESPEDLPMHAPDSFLSG